MGMMDDERDVGVRAGRTRKRRLWLLFGSIMTLGAVVDAVLIPMIRRAPPATSALPPAAAVTGALMFVLLLNGGSWLYLRHVDELEYQDNLVAFSVGFFFNISAFLAWFFLWIGGLAPRPEAFILFGGTFVVGALAYCFLKARRLL
jgi:hypothetical protein